MVLILLWPRSNLIVKKKLSGIPMNPILCVRVNHPWRLTYVEAGQRVFFLHGLLIPPMSQLNCVVCGEVTWCVTGLVEQSSARTLKQRTTPFTTITLNNLPLSSWWRMRHKFHPATTFTIFLLTEHTIRLPLGRLRSVVPVRCGAVRFLTVDNKWIYDLSR